MLRIQPVQFCQGHAHAAEALILNCLSTSLGGQKFLAQQGVPEGICPFTVDLAVLEKLPFAAHPGFFTEPASRRVLASERTAA